ncbi:molybdopterin-guanine dinucleotide biosynthesis protein MobB [Listeria floridensis FSL S10-1187]|uniref:Molybdopterin-guanine dinucleotide biosynthesis protein MobB n=1 Tax=Listeria floridensis FSL S10-1187 TaxID=1265817 RepID=A0ABP3B0K6_9LIST|nr:molybdopterin-guanine dinucleotide biosynthesis protein B [Listeria floridensis]EUJ33054.1 molybdopterin-guanine dinucleotide biosynthesis protein MobB [Listeria floridensis FSL S10-1187]
MAVILQVVGYKNSGKTTFLNALIHQAKQAGYQVAAIKHDAHSFEMDHPGTDSMSYRESGADHVALVSSRQFAFLSNHGLSLQEALKQMPPADLILVEGYKEAPFPKVALVRSLEELTEFEATLRQVAVFASKDSLASSRIREIGDPEQIKNLAESLIEEFLR